jgi:DNA-binding NtrC family response regulator
MKSPTVLALDCDSDALIALEHALENAGFRTTTTWHVSEAIALLNDSCFEVVLLRRHPQIDADAIYRKCAQKGTCAVLALDSFCDHENILQLLSQQHARRKRPIPEPLSA